MDEWGKKKNGQAYKKKPKTHSGQTNEQSGMNNSRTKKQLKKSNQNKPPKKTQYTPKYPDASSYFQIKAMKNNIKNPNIIKADIKERSTELESIKKDIFNWEGRVYKLRKYLKNNLPKSERDDIERKICFFEDKVKDLHVEDSRLTLYLKNYDDFYLQNDN